jgi:MFS family permease
MVLFFPETCRPLVGDGSILPHPAYRTLPQILKTRRAQSIEPTSTSSTTPAKPQPKLRLTPPNVLGSLQLLFQRELGLLLFYTGLLFAGFYAIGTAIPSQMSRLYGYNEVQVGLVYLPMAGGSIVAAFVVGPAINRNYRRHARKLGLEVDKSRQMDLRNFPIERARLEIAIPLIILSTIGMLAWGWALQSGTSIAVPIILLFFIGVGLIGVANTGNTLAIDITPGKAGTVVAANNLTRCLLGALFSAVILPLIDAIGTGWAYTIIALLYVVGLPSMFVIMWKGMAWREEERVKAEKKKERRRVKEEPKKKNAQSRKGGDAEKDVSREGRSSSGGRERAAVAVARRGDNTRRRARRRHEGRNVKIPAWHQAESYAFEGKSLRDIPG